MQAGLGGPGGDIKDGRRLSTERVFIKKLLELIDQVIPELLTSAFIYKRYRLLQDNISDPFIEFRDVQYSPLFLHFFQNNFFLLPKLVATVRELHQAAKTSHLRLTIQDNGTGISAEHMARLFEPFFTTKTNGTGLGLLITRRIIQEHRGTITVQSQPDKGTCFQITFPGLA